MKTLSRAARTLVVAGLLLAPHSPAALTAQAESRAPLFLAIPETFPDVDARVVIVREPGRDIVLLKPGDTTPEALSVALDLLRRLDRPRPVQGRAQMIPITGFVVRDGLPEARRGPLQEALAELRERPVARIGTLGPGRWMPYDPT